VTVTYELNLTILSGPHAGHAVAIPSGAPRTFGRGAPSDLVLDDQYLSDVHFAIWTDGSVALVRDLQSHNGTWLNQQPVTESPLRDGDRVSAGQTVLQVSLVALRRSDPGAADDGELTPEQLAAGMQRAHHDCARWALQHHDGGLFAVIDVARDPDLLVLLNATGEEFCAFDETREPDDLAATAPVLARLTPATEALAFLEVYAHLLGFAPPPAGSDEPAPPRFYDPAALRPMLAAMEPGARQQFLQPFSAVMAEDADGASMLQYALRDGSLEVTELAMTLGGA
jgi:predicted component of type VI protein secretion system